MKKKLKSTTNKGGKKLELDEELLRRVASVGCSYEEIAYIVGCGRHTLMRRYKEVIEKERAKKYASLRAAQFKYALKGNASLLIFLGKIYLKQKPEGDEDSETINVYINDDHKAKVSKKKGKDESEKEELCKDE